MCSSPVKKIFYLENYVFFFTKNNQFHFWLVSDTYGNWTGILVRLVVPYSDPTWMTHVNCSVHPTVRTDKFLRITTLFYRNVISTLNTQVHLNCDHETKKARYIWGWWAFAVKLQTHQHSGLFKMRQLSASKSFDNAYIPFNEA